MPDLDIDAQLRALLQATAVTDSDSVEKRVVERLDQTLAPAPAPAPSRRSVMRRGRAGLLMAWGLLAAAGGTAAAVTALSGDSAQRSRAAVAAALTAGEPVRLTAPQRRIIATARGEGFTPVVARARRVLAPDGRNHWIVVPSADAGACLITTSGASCNPAHVIASGRSGLMIIKPVRLTSAARKAYASEFRRRLREARRRGAQNFTMPREPPGQARKRGIAPADAATVEARDYAGQLVAITSVTRGLYEVRLGTERTTRSIVFKDREGEVVATSSP
ncbi:hypothetical protein DSM112329_02896 [Paraconexibacter sp. AEG42_29]|uniref:PepSY domain-containing protein n=1 Tax=Paraconexibacter sp. AEG42_29 TaxID=2997339 RepID=A0AAU7AWG4_9ACTN